MLFREWLAYHKREMVRFAVLFLVLAVSLFGLSRLIYFNTAETVAEELLLDEAYLAASSAESNLSSGQPEEAEPIQEIIVVDIKGAVKKPGVYQAEG